MTAEVGTVREGRACPTLHNRTEPSRRHERAVASLTVWPDGSAVRIRRPAGKPQPGGRQCGVVTPSGDRCRNRAMHASDRCAVHSGAVRSEVTSFTGDARRRLMHLLARIRRDQDALLVTLTWPTWAAPTCEEWHRSWNQYRTALIRRFPKSGGVWRREFTRAGVVHLHLLVYGVTYREVRAWCPSAWADCVRAPDHDLRERVGTSVERAERWSATVRYIAKYISKGERESADRSYGRWYGVFGQANIPWAVPESEEVSDRVAVQLIRAARRFVAAGQRRRGLHRRRRPAPSAGFTIVAVDPQSWSRLAALLTVQERL